jgi:hypothetical protein
MTITERPWYFLGFIGSPRADFAIRFSWDAESGSEDAQVRDVIIHAATPHWGSRVKCDQIPAPELAEASRLCLRALIRERFLVRPLHVLFARILLRVPCVAWMVHL